MANALVAVRSLANALGKCQFAADKHMSQSHPLLPGLSRRGALCPLAGYKPTAARGHPTRRGRWEGSWHVAAAAAKLLQSCPTMHNPIDVSPPGSPVPGILQARALEWVAISFSNAWKWKVKVKSLSRVWLLATSWTAAYQAPPSMGFSGQEYWSGVPLPSPK